MPDRCTNPTCLDHWPPYDLATEALTCAVTHGWANCPPNEAGDVRCHNDGERVNVRCWKCGTPRPKPSTDQHGPHED